MKSKFNQTRSQKIYDKMKLKFFSNKKETNRMSLQRLKFQTILELTRYLKKNQVKSLVISLISKMKKQKMINYKHKSRIGNFKVLKKRRINSN